MIMLYLVIIYSTAANQTLLRHPPYYCSIICADHLNLLKCHPSIPGELNDREDVEVEEVLIHLNAVLKIRIRMFLGLQDPDPDPLVRGTDPAPDPSLF
jgi:hypothetical protein